MKKSMRLVCLLLVLLVLLAVFFGLKKNNANQSDIVAETEITVIDVKKEDVVRISYDYEGENYSFEKVDGVWYYAPDHSVEVTQMFVSSMSGIVGPLRAKQAIEGVADMSQYGFAEDVRTIRFETKEAAYSVELGTYNSLADVYYMRIPSESTVYVISSITVEAFNKSLEDIAKIEEVTE